MSVWKALNGKKNDDYLKVFEGLGYGFIIEREDGAQNYFAEDEDFNRNFII